MDQVGLGDHSILRKRLQDRVTDIKEVQLEALLAKLLMRRG